MDVGVPADGRLTTLFVSSCGPKRLEAAALTLQNAPGIVSVAGPIQAEGAYWCVEALVAIGTAPELEARFNVLWAESGPLSLATMAPSRHWEITWWLRLIIGRDGVPANERWRGQWPIALLAELVVSPELVASPQTA